MKNDFDLIEKKFSEFKKKFETLKMLDKELSSLYSRGFESEVESLKLKLKSPDKISEIEKGIEELKRKIGEKNVEHTDKVVPENAYGVVIGIAKYEDEGIPALKYAKEDALEIYNILTDPKYGNFPRENVKLLLDEQATLTEIKSAMGTFLARYAVVDDMVCIYFAGHGSP